MRKDLKKYPNIQIIIDKFPKSKIFRFDFFKRVIKIRTKS